MDPLGAEVSSKILEAIKAKLVELDVYVDDELPDYIMVMVANNKDRATMEADLRLFLNEHTDPFVDWLAKVLDKLKKVKMGEFSSIHRFSQIRDVYHFTFSPFPFLAGKEKKKKVLKKKAKNAEDGQEEGQLPEEGKVKDSPGKKKKKKVVKKTSPSKVKVGKKATSKSRERDLPEDGEEEEYDPVLEEERRKIKKKLAELDAISARSRSRSQRSRSRSPRGYDRRSYSRSPERRRRSPPRRSPPRRSPPRRSPVRRRSPPGHRSPPRRRSFDRREDDHGRRSDRGRGDSSQGRREKSSIEKRLLDISEGNNVRGGREGFGRREKSRSRTPERRDRKRRKSPSEPRVSSSIGAVLTNDSDGEYDPEQMLKKSLVASQVKVPERESKGRVKASKNLVLKAVAEADRSIKTNKRPEKDELDAVHAKRMQLSRALKEGTLSEDKIKEINKKVGKEEKRREKELPKKRSSDDRDRGRRRDSPPNIERKRMRADVEEEETRNKLRLLAGMPEDKAEKPRKRRSDARDHSRDRSRSWLGRSY